jgi:hypothetical protein
MSDAEALARTFIEAEGEQVVRDMAGHVGEELFDALKRNGMLMQSVAGAVGAITLAAAQTLSQAHDFLRRSLADESDGTPPVKAGADEAEAIALLFVGELPVEMKAALHKASAPPPPRQREEEFAISDDGIVTALPTWKRDNEAIFMRLHLTSAYPTDEEVASWTDDQAREADIWACAAMLSASDNDDIQVPVRPAFLPDRRWVPGDSIMAGAIVDADSPSP